MDELKLPELPAGQYRRLLELADQIAKPQPDAAVLAYLEEAAALALGLPPEEVAKMTAERQVDAVLRSLRFNRDAAQAGIVAGLKAAAAAKPLEIPQEIMAVIEAAATFEQPAAAERMRRRALTRAAIVRLEGSGAAA